MDYVSYTRLVSVFSNSRGSVAFKTSAPKSVYHSMLILTPIWANYLLKLIDYVEILRRSYVTKIKGILNDTKGIIN